MVCINCRDLKLSYRNGSPCFGENSWSTFCTFSDLAATAKLGCLSCQFIRDGLENMYTSTSIIADRELLKLTKVHLIPSFNFEGSTLQKRQQSLLVQAQWAGGDAEIDSLQFYTDDDKVWESFSALNYVPQHSSGPLSPQGIAQAKQWLEQCLNSHPNCPKPQQTLPTRVIAVGDSNTEPKLYEPASDENEAYVALSYCWGMTRTLLTTQSTLPHRKAGFALSDLPRTCREAVIFARQLDIKYLWIDSLCIIQDSPSDWERESARMCSIYENASVTFAAVDSPDSDTGLFITWDGSRSVQLQCPVGPVYVRRDLHRGLVPVSSTDRLEAGVLSTRGWTMQEISLSPRVLKFSGRELLWSCGSENACECSPSNESLFDDAVSDGASMTVGNTSLELKRWKGMVDEFSARKFTYQTDRLPALSGLAARMQRSLPHRYMCGIWEVDLVEQLQWYLIDSLASNTLGSLDDKYAPSWSWASAGGHVRFRNTADYPPPEKLYTAECSNFQLNSVNEYGPGQGSLAVEGFLLPLTCEQGDVVYRSEAGSMHQFRQESFNAISNPSSPFWIPDRRAEAGQLRGTRLSLLFATQFLRDQEFAVNGLVLEQIDATASTFRRIGYAETTFQPLRKHRVSGSLLPRLFTRASKSPVWELLGQKRNITIV
ncbi:HET-domain-containing protein [Polyplosphaeria fusca]|uniref:HET-domain-containing protein n=1 Tax=Polyplosphaeria fusca TaxID=682080 RepID=A0A9P4QT89_9PLEO|nr:HET-domain-containing protein [Polyplosphaeria fusca]